MMLGLIGAMACEVDTLHAQMTDVAVTQVAGMTFYCGMLMGHQTVLALAGVGKVHAAMCAQVMIERFSPALILSIGVAGALTEDAQIGDVFIAESAVQHDMDTSPIGDPKGMISGINLVYLPCDPDAAQKLMDAARQAQIPASLAIMATGDQFIDSLSMKESLHAEFGASCCDMETAAIAQVAYENHIPFAAYRAVSDTLMGNGKEYQENVLVAADASSRLLCAYLN